MAQFPAFPLWTDAYLGDTHHLTTIEHGAYMLLLIAMWRSDGTLPNDDHKLARMARLGPQQWARIKDAIIAFMDVSPDGARITQGRLFDELTFVRAHSRKQAKNARARWQNITAGPPAVKQHPDQPLNGDASNPLENNEAGDAVAMPDACQTDAPTPTPIIEREKPYGFLSETEISDAPSKAKKPKKYSADFEAAWKAYPTDANMSKIKAYGAWQKLDAEDRVKAAAGIPGFVSYCSKNPTYRAVHMVRFINERRFDGFIDAPSPPRLTSVETWQARLGLARERRQWSTPDWGPMPGQPGCAVPVDLLQAGDGHGWHEHDRAA